MLVMLHLFPSPTDHPTMIGRQRGIGLIISREGLMFTQETGLSRSEGDTHHLHLPVLRHFCQTHPNI